MAFKILAVIERFKVFFISAIIGILVFAYHLFMAHDKQKLKKDKDVIIDWYKTKQIEINESQKDMIESNISSHDNALEATEAKIENVNESKSKELIDNINDIKRLGY